MIRLTDDGRIRQTIGFDYCVGSELSTQLAYPYQRLVMKLPSRQPGMANLFCFLDVAATSFQKIDDLYATDIDTLPATNETARSIGTIVRAKMVLILGLVFFAQYLTLYRFAIFAVFIVKFLLGLRNIDFESWILRTFMRHHERRNVPCFLIGK